ncbi:hypothetical protein BLNAU_12776 [Blattamonas nauphoetae]|uniref:SPRY domain-containing protein n=1 Tax=Blattamonas nauphoetae TaxID=2049346 RepID=A0ABQ9XLG9_9EUKA|nr:hypothetical protein BLNAU_12776 [Blattamonas nauphoetae]
METELPEGWFSAEDPESGLVLLLLPFFFYYFVCCVQAGLIITHRLEFANGIHQALVRLNTQKKRSGTRSIRKNNLLPTLRIPINPQNLQQLQMIHLEALHKEEHLQSTNTEVDLEPCIHPLNPQKRRNDKILTVLHQRIWKEHSKQTGRLDLASLAPIKSAIFPICCNQSIGACFEAGSMFPVLWNLFKFISGLASLGARPFDWKASTTGKTVILQTYLWVDGLVSLLYILASFIFFLLTSPSCTSHNPITSLTSDTVPSTFLSELYPDINTPLTQLYLQSSSTIPDTISSLRFSSVGLGSMLRLSGKNAFPPGSEYQNNKIKNLTLIKLIFWIIFIIFSFIWTVVGWISNIFLDYRYFIITSGDTFGKRAGFLHTIASLSVIVTIAWLVFIVGTILVAMNPLIHLSNPLLCNSAFSMHQLLPANPVPSTYLLNCDSPFPRPPPPYCRPNVSLIEDIEEYSPSAAQCFDFINGCSENYGDDDADSIASLDSLNSSCLSFDVEFCDSPFELVLTNQHTHFALEHCFNHDTPLTSLEEPEANWAQSVHVTPVRSLVAKKIVMTSSVKGVEIPSSQFSSSSKIHLAPAHLQTLPPLLFTDPSHFSVDCTIVARTEFGTDNKGHCDWSSLLISDPFTSGVVSITITLLSLQENNGDIVFGVIDSNLPIPAFGQLLGKWIRPSVGLNRDGNIYYASFSLETYCHPELEEGDCVRMEINLDSTPRTLQFFVNGEAGQCYEVVPPRSVRIGFSVAGKGTSFRIDNISRLSQPTPIEPRCPCGWMPSEDVKING